jgi:hypothetical protein
MRGLLERTLMAWGGRGDPQFDYAWRARQLIDEWKRLIADDDLPARIREFVVTDRADAKRVARALLRRLDRIEGGQVEEEAVPQSHITQPAAPPAPEPSARPSTKQAAAPRDYLFGWQDILKAINRKARDRETVRGLNERLGGPIWIAGRGGRPRVDRAELLAWWNRLGEIYKANDEAAAESDRDRKAVGDNQYTQGREGHADTVAPDISGRVKRRRRTS